MKNPYTHKFAWEGWKFGVLKTSMVAFGMLIGSYFPVQLQPWQPVMLGVFLVTALLTSYWALGEFKKLAE